VFLKRVRGILPLTLFVFFPSPGPSGHLLRMIVAGRGVGVRANIGFHAKSLDFDEENPPLQQPG
jgi:hypothetical protein